MAGAKKSVLPTVKVQELSSEDLTKHVGKLSKLFKHAETRRRSIEQTMEHHKNKIANGGRNTDQTKSRFEKVLEDLENVQAEYDSIASALHEAQTYLEETMRASQVVPSSPLTPVPDLDESESEGEHFSGLESPLSTTDSDNDLPATDVTLETQKHVKNVGRVERRESSTAKTEKSTDQNNHTITMPKPQLNLTIEAKAHSEAGPNPGGKDQSQVGADAKIVQLDGGMNLSVQPEIDVATNLSVQPGIDVGMNPSVQPEIDVGTDLDDQPGACVTKASQGPGDGNQPKVQGDSENQAKPGDAPPTLVTRTQTAIESDGHGALDPDSPRLSARPSTQTATLMSQLVGSNRNTSSLSAPAASGRSEMKKTGVLESIREFRNLLKSKETSIDTRYDMRTGHTLYSFGAAERDRIANGSSAQVVWQEMSQTNSNLEKDSEMSETRQAIPKLPKDNEESIEPNTTREIELETSKAEQSDLSPATVVKKVSGEASDDSGVGASHTRAAKKQPRKRKRTVVDDTDVEDSVGDSATPPGKQRDDSKAERQRQKKRERQSEKDDENAEKEDDKDDKLDPETEAEIIRAIGTRGEKETLAQYDRRRAGTLAMQKQASKEIAAFNKDPQLWRLSPAVRKLCRSIADFMPETGTSHRALSIAVLTTGQGNIRCPFHAVNDHRSRFFDGDGVKPAKRPWAVTGVAMPPTKGSRKKNPVSPPEGHLHCGCQLEIVLLDFYYWKSGTISSPNFPSQTEPWFECMHPRTRGLVYGEWAKKTGLVLDDLWSLRKNARTKSFDVKVTEAERLRAQISRLEEQLEELKEESKEAPAQRNLMELYVDIDEDQPEPSSSKLELDLELE